VTQLGRLDIVCSNAGISSFGRADELDETTWQDMIDINLTGMWHACKAAIPHLVDGGRGGSIVITSSDAGLKGYQNLAHYVSAKHGVVGLMRTLALELAPALHQGQFAPPEHRGHRHDPERGHLPAVPPPTWTIPAGRSWPTQERPSTHCRSHGWSRPTSPTRCCS